MSVHICSIKRYCVRVNENKLILPMRTMLYKLVATIVVANVFVISCNWFAMVPSHNKRKLPTNNQDLQHLT